MTLRKGEITLAEIKRKWLYHVALSANKVHGMRNSEIYLINLADQSLRWLLKRRAAALAA